MNDRGRRGGRKPISLAQVGTIKAVVADPSGTCSVTVSRRVDILELERAHRRISEAAYRTGRRVQAIFEEGDRLLGFSNWRMDNRVDLASPLHSRMERAVDAAAKVVPLIQDMRGRLGRTDATLLRAVLSDRLAFAQCAADLRGKAGESETNYIGRRFRDALEDLAESWAARGPGRPATADSFAELAAAHAV